MDMNAIGGNPESGKLRDVYESSAEMRCGVSCTSYLVNTRVSACVA